MRKLLDVHSSHESAEHVDYDYNVVLEFLHKRLVFFSELSHVGYKHLYEFYELLSNEADFACQALLNAFDQFLVSEYLFTLLLYGPWVVDNFLGLQVYLVSLKVAFVQYQVKKIDYIDLHGVVFLFNNVFERTNQRTYDHMSYLV